LLHDLASSVLDDARRMVDDLQVEASAANGVKVTLVKWGNRRIHQNHRAGDLASGNV
jgi:hypothetical protein